MPRTARLLLVFVACLHLGLLACYTLPAVVVPEPLRVLRTVMVRGLFHQQWMLFAPDPPLCSCQVQVKRGAQDWTTLGDDHGHYLQRRMARGIAWNVQRELSAGAGVLSAPVAQALRNMAGDDAIHYRIEERCVDDPQHPAQRSLRHTELRLP